MKKIMWFCDKCKEPIATQRLAIGFEEEAGELEVQRGIKKKDIKVVEEGLAEMRKANLARIETLGEGKESE